MCKVKTIGQLGVDHLQLVWRCKHIRIKVRKRSALALCSLTKQPCSVKRLIEEGFDKKGKAIIEEFLNKDLLEQTPSQLFR